jgi:hypothetical protein
LTACGSSPEEVRRTAEVDPPKDVSFNSDLYETFYSRFVAEGREDVVANCLAGVFSSTALWHGEEVGHNAGEQDPNQTPEQFASYHPFLRASKNINCAGPRTDWEKFGKSVGDEIWVDVAGICATNSPEPSCDASERHRVTFVTARQAAHAYCFEQTGSSSCGHSGEVGRCLASRYAHEYMLVPPPGDDFSYGGDCAGISLKLG